MVKGDDVLITSVTVEDRSDTTKLTLWREAANLAHVLVTMLK